MSRSPAAFAGPIYKVENAMSARYVRQVRASENRAIKEILEHPNYRVLVDTTETWRTHVREDGSRGRGRPATIPLELIFGVCVVSLVLGISLRAARHRVYSDDELRVALALSPLSSAKAARLSEHTDGEITDPDFPAERTWGYFYTWTEQRDEEYFALVERLVLLTAAQAIHRHDIPTNWIAVDGTRVRAATSDPDGDEGTAVHSRGGDELPFNQRHHYSAVLGSVPLLINHHIVPPTSEAEYWRTEGIPNLARASEILANTLTELRRADGDARPHPGLRRSAVASDAALVGAPALRALISHGFVPATKKPRRNPAAKGTHTVELATGIRQFVSREDGSVVCTACQTHLPVPERQPMQTLAGEFGVDVQIRCVYATCPHRNQTIKLPLRAPDTGKWIAGTTVYRGEPNPHYISILPTYSSQYIARRFYGLQRVEWAHAQFERLFALGTKNKSFDRRTIKGTHPNRVWWSLAGLIWNIIVSENLNSGRVDLEIVQTRGQSRKRRGGTTHIDDVVANYWAKDREIEAKRQLKKMAEERAKAATHGRDRPEVEPPSPKAATDSRHGNRAQPKRGKRKSSRSRAKQTKPGVSAMS